MVITHESITVWMTVMNNVNAPTMSATVNHNPTNINNYIMNSLGHDHRRWKLITRQAMDTNGHWSHGSWRRRHHVQKKVVYLIFGHNFGEYRSDFQISFIDRFSRKLSVCHREIDLTWKSNILLFSWTHCIPRHCYIMYHDNVILTKLLLYNKQTSNKIDTWYQHTYYMDYSR